MVCNGWKSWYGRGGWRPNTLKSNGNEGEEIFRINREELYLKLLCRGIGER